MIAFVPVDLETAAAAHGSASQEARLSYAVTGAFDLECVTVAGQAAAVLGFAMVRDRLWLVYDVIDAELSGRFALTTARHFRALLRQRGCDVFALCHDQRFPTAPRVCRIMGFVPTDQFWDDTRIWLWQKSR